MGSKYEYAVFVRFADFVLDRAFALVVSDFENAVLLKPFHHLPIVDKRAVRIDFVAPAVGAAYCYADCALHTETKSGAFCSDDFHVRLNPV